MKNILFVYTILDDDNEFIALHVSILRELGYEVFISVEEFWKPSRVYDFVVINWPEALFDWSFKGSDEEVINLTQRFKQFRIDNSKIIFFLHDEYSNSTRSANLNLIFDICFNRSDIFIHLGAYSLHKYSSIFSNAKHYEMPHPLYKDFQFDLDYNNSRLRLAIKNNEFFVIVPGSIRDAGEIEYCKKILRRLSPKNKKMVFLRSRYFINPGKIHTYNNIKEWIYYLFKTIFYLKDNITFLSGFMPASKMSLYFSAADLVIIPRLHTLNSGNITLAAQFGKNMVGSGSGNMRNLLEALDQKVITHDNLSVEDIKIENFDKLSDRINVIASNKFLTKIWRSILL